MLRLIDIPQGFTRGTVIMMVMFWAYSLSSYASFSHLAKIFPFIIA
jgi:hypothetical protein